MFLFVWGAKVFIHLRTEPADAREYFATAKQWMWKIQHPEGHREINTLHVPINVPIKLTMTSEDVIHSFFVPAFRVKQDVLPGRYTSVWFEATKVGSYHLFCAEYCGTEHSLMIGKVIVMPQDEYQDWLAGEVAGQPPAQAGEQVFEKYVCNSCHSDDGSGRGPSLVGIYGKEVALADGKTIVVDEEYLRESILLPNAKTVAGYQPLMPTYQGQINEAGVMQLIAYMKTLTEGGEEATEAPADTATTVETDKDGLEASL
jgi:cytochrome c oxidase subunit 2